MPGQISSGRLVAFTRCSSADVIFGFSATFSSVSTLATVCVDSGPGAPSEALDAAGL